MDILFKNAHILTMNDNEEIFLGCLAVEEGKITYVGKAEPKRRYEKEIDCQGNLLMPGFKDAHAHSAMVFARNYADKQTLHDWLFKTIFPMEAKLAKDDQYHLSKVAVLEYLSSGITACFDMYFSLNENARAFEEMGFRAVLLSMPNGDNVDIMKQEYEHFNSRSPLLSCQLGFHAEYTSKEEKLIRISKVAHELKAPIYTHISETASEVEECKTRHNGLTPPEYLDSLGLFDYGGGGYHCVHFTPNDIEIFKKHGCSVISNPGSNSKLASGIAPLKEFSDNGLNIALGTDGPASNNALDMFYEMRLSSVLQGIKCQETTAFSAKQALYAATVGGAKAMRLFDSDTLAPGKNADVIMIDLRRPEMQPINNIEASLVYSCGKQDVKMTMVAGKILYQDGQFFVNEDIDKIYSKAEEITRRLQSK